MKKLRICYYVTSHGYGHGVRTIAVCSSFSPAIELTIRTALPETFFRRELGEMLAWHGAAFDCGCLQTDGVTVDIAATIDCYCECARRNRVLLPQEVQWLKEERFDGVVSDTVPFAFEAAAQAGLPSCAVANFTWYDIYLPYCIRYPHFAPVVETIREQYQMATHLVEAAPALPMPFFGTRTKVGVIGKRGRCRRKQLMQQLGLAQGTAIGLIYTGTFGMERVEWRRLESCSGWFFIGVTELGCAVRNYAVVDTAAFPVRDLAASADCIISKIGYGIYADCLLNGTPLVYLPRSEFAEYPVLEAGVHAWGYGVRLTPEEYYALAWENALEQVLCLPRPLPVGDRGAAMAADVIENLLGGN